MSTKRLLGLLALVAIFVRLYFFIGLVSGDPQDDGIYYLHALGIVNDGPRYLERYRHLSPAFVSNPIDQFDVRPMSTYPVALAFELFGPGETAAVLWSLTCSTLSLLVVYRMAALMHSRRAGLFAALLLALYPLDVVMATRILSDEPLGFLCGLGTLGAMTALASEGDSTLDARLAAWLGGVAFGLGYLANPRALLVLGFVVVLAAGTGGTTRRWRVPTWVLLGFLTIFLAEASTYYWTTGEPFLNLKIHGGANTFKYLNEPTVTWRWGSLEVHQTNGRPFQILQTVFAVQKGRTDFFGLYFFLFAASVAYAVFRRRYVFVTALAAALFLFLEFGFVGVHWNPSNRVIEYWMVFKQERFLTILSVPLTALSGCVLAGVAKRQPLVATGILILLAVTSVRAIDRTQAFYRSGLVDLRTIADDVLRQPGRTFHTDPWADTHLRIFTQYRADNLRSMNQNDQPYPEDNACVIVGGSRGIELQADYVESALPPWARQLGAAEQPHAGWKLMRMVPGPRTRQRLHDLRIYCRS